MDGGAGPRRGYLEPLRSAQVDTLVLGCTHYPLLSGLIQLAMGDDVTLVSSAEETAKDLLRVLTELDLLRPTMPPPRAACSRRQVIPKPSRCSPPGSSGGDHRVQPVARPAVEPPLMSVATIDSRRESRVVSH